MTARPSDSKLVPLFELARGGMGRVDLVVRRGAGDFHRLYALKRLAGHAADDESARAMFLQEARVAGLLRHPHVVPVLDVGEDEDGPYLLMEYVEGVSLAQLLKAIAGQDLLEIDECLYVVEAVARALHAAHELRQPDGTPLGLIHRDVSPSNVMITVDGQAMLTDFGIARVETSDARTTTGVLKGKFGYMSPEQLRFEPLDRRSDLFALGVVLFEALSGRRLFRERDLRKAAWRILHEEPPDVSEVRRGVPDTLVAVVFDLLSRDPDARPATAEALAETLRAIADESGWVPDHGRAKLAERVRDTFAEPLGERRERIAASLAEGPRPGRTSSHPEGSEPTELEVEIDIDEVAAPHGSRGALLAVALLASLAVLGAGAFWATTEDEPAGLSGGLGDSADTPEGRPEPPTTGAPTTRPEDEPPAPSGPSATAQPDASAPAVAESDAGPPAPRRRRRRRRSASERWTPPRP